jgi:hypothetical protein
MAAADQFPAFLGQVPGNGDHSLASLGCLLPDDLASDPPPLR